MHYPLPYYFDIALIISFSVRGAKLHIIIQTTKRNYIINIILITLSGKPKEGGRTHRVLPLKDLCLFAGIDRPTLGHTSRPY